MRRHRSGMPGGLIAVALLVVLACGALACAEGAESGEPEAPATVQKAADGQPSRVILTARAAERLGIQTVAVQTMNEGAAPAATTSASIGQKLTIPYSAVLYDADGATWTFTSPEPLVFVRALITVEHIQGDRTVLSSGPPVGTAVVTVGAAELLGAERGVGHE